MLPWRLQRFIVTLMFATIYSNVTVLFATIYSQQRYHILQFAII